jgi:hypothetical protein
LTPTLHSRQMPALSAKIARAAPIDADRHHGLLLAIVLRQLTDSNSTTRIHSDLAIDQLCW